MADLRIVDALEIPTENITGEEKLPTGGSGNYSITLDSVADYTKTKKDLAGNSSVDSKVGGVRQELNTHIKDLLNPHQVTKGQIGLGNVDNTADADKPVSNSAQAAIISAVTPKANKTYVDNQLTLKANKVDVDSSLLTKSDKTYVDNQLTLKADKTEIVEQLSLKSDKTYVDNQLLTKADKTYIDNQLPLKANKTYVDSQHLSLQSQIDQKAETEYVDAALSNLSTVASKFYPTLAEANADIANITVNQPVTVGDVANGGLWYKATTGATTLTKSLYDPLEQAKIYTDKAVSSVLEKGVNLFNKDATTLGKYYNYENGELWDAAATLFAASEFIKVEPNTEYQVPTFYDQQFAFFNSSKNYISGQANASPTFKFTTPSNAKYIGLTVKVPQLDTFMFCKSSEFPAQYVPYYVNNDSLKINTDQIFDFESQVQEIAHLENINIVDPSVLISGKYYNYGNGELWDAAWASAGLYEVEANTTYQTSTFYDQQFAFFDASKVYISGQINALPDNVFTTPINAAYIGLTVPNAQINTLVVAKQSIFPAVYVPFGVNTFSDVILPDNTPKTTNLTVSATINGANAIQNKIDSLTDATDKNRYQVDVAAGVYKVEQANQFLGYPTYPAMICPKSHIDIVGKGLDKTIVWAELPYIDANISNAANGESYPRERYQTIYNYADDVTIRGITFVGQNLRYTVHQDDSRGVDTKRYYVDCGFVFKGDKGWKQTLGIGTHSGEETYVKGGYSQSDGLFAFACHNNVDFKYPSVWSFENHTFSSLGDAQAISMQSCGSLVDDKLELIGCALVGRSYILTYGDSSWMTASENRDYFNHAEWQVTGYNNEPFLFNNAVEDSCLRFKTIATGVSTSIRFDKNSSAYPLLVKNNRLNTDKSAYTGRDYIDGYIVQDGSVDMSAQAWGCRDVSERVYIYDGSTNFTSLGKRLGDCSTTSKTLGVIVNGTSNTITFNKNYSAMTNAQIITEMNAQLSGVTVGLYSYGRDYYPQLSDATEVVYNTGSTFIPKGSIVAKSKGDIHLAGENDKVYGAALDDIPVVRLDASGAKKGQGRVLKRGYISTDRSKAHFVLADNQSPTVGTRFKVVNGQLITDISGKISVDVDDGVISINC